MAIGLPFVLLGIGEWIGRSHGYGGYPPIFRRLGETDGAAWYGTDQRGLSTFFLQNLTTVGSMEEQVLRMPKPAGTVRIAMVGGSAARGYPQPPTLAASSFLRAMLEDAWADREVELFNAGTTAIASFPVMYIVDELLAFDLDLLIVYSGNNEFYGAHGVASVHRFGTSTATMRCFRFLRRSALVQWLVDRATKRAAEDSDAEGRPQVLMERVIADAMIEPDDRLRTAARRNLSRHLDWIVRACRKRGVPVILCTLPANERDLAPIGGDPPGSPDLDAEIDRLVAASAETPDLRERVDLLEGAVDRDAQRASAWYALGRARAAAGDPAGAAAAYLRARDLDTMPWRAPSSFNETIRSVAADHGVVLCDLDAAFRAESGATGAPGWDLLDDHVHPSLRGQALAARSMLAAMTKLPDPVAVDPGAIVALPAWEEYAARLGDDPLYRYGVVHRIRSLLAAPFYRRNNEAALARFEEICAGYEEAMTPVERGAVEEWKNPGAHRGGHRPITAMAGMRYAEAREWQEADRLLTIGRAAVPGFSVWNLQFGWRALDCRRCLYPELRPEDRALAEEIVANGTTFIDVTGVRPPPVARYVGLALHRLGRDREAIDHLGEAVRFAKGIDGFEVVAGLARSLAAVGRTADMERLLTMPVSDPAVRDECARLLADLRAAEE